MKTLEELTKLQAALSKRVILEDHFRKPIRRIAGVDLAFVNDKAVAACVALDYGSLEVIEQKTTIVKLSLPYCAGLLWFREGPAIMQVIRRMELEPNIFMINAHGIAHPRRCGCASHVGVTIGKPTIGVAGARLYGEYSHLPTKFSERVPLVIDGDIVGWVIKPAEGRPIYVSPGHMVSLESAAKIVTDCLRDHRLPEPIYLSHRLANSAKKKL